ncbi:MAG: hypothetical protein F6K39_45925, partial [Okeania sp. SIO3B3]|nr:hypothetical protein [Okeania sp. SIO3B3]
SGTNQLKWIDFDYNYTYQGRENIFGYDIFGLGNVFTFITARGDVLIEDLQKNKPNIYNQININDRNIIFRNRVVNLKKIYPYIPQELNLILLHFGINANMFYLNTGEFLSSLIDVREKLK